VYETDGLLLVEDGRVVAAGAYAALRNAIAPDAIVRDLRDKLIVPGFIDSHIHYPQTDMIASPAPGLLPWLNTYTFPTERKFEDPAYARETAAFSSMNCWLAARPPRSCTARSTSNPPMPSSAKANRATCA
jgi:guanine deaminase